MSVRKRTWKTAAGEERQAWLCDYTDQSGKRHVKTFARKKDADAFIAKAKVEVREGRSRGGAIASQPAIAARASSRTQTRIGAPERPGLTLWAGGAAFRKRPLTAPGAP